MSFRLLPLPMCPPINIEFSSAVKLFPITKELVFAVLFDPKTNELIYKPERFRIRFKASKKLNKIINE